MHRQRRVARDRRRLGGRIAVVCVARADGAAGLQERVRAGRVRVVLGVPGRRPGVLVPGRGGAGRGAAGGGRGGAPVRGGGGGGPPGGGRGGGGGRGPGRRRRGRAPPA